MIGKKCGLERGEEVDEHRVSTPTFLGKERERERGRRRNGRRDMAYWNLF